MDTTLENTPEEGATTPQPPQDDATSQLLLQLRAENANLHSQVAHLTEQYTSSSQQATALEERYRQTLINSAIELAALATNAIKPQILHRLIDPTKITVDLAAGTVSGVSEAVEALRSSDPYLFAKAAPNMMPPPPSSVRPDTTSEPAQPDPALQAQLLASYRRSF